MRINLHYYPDEATAEQLDRIEDKLGSIIPYLEILMSSFDDLKAAQDATDAKIASVKTDVETLLAKLAAIPPAGLTPEQQTALDDAVTHAGSINDKLSAVDASVNPPA